ncbi:MAG: hypothetical protein GC152_03925 [Alphaproteobacteria bacterium]|nr:hypothetical protein [Alphaproteobacteria bacterium]
MLQTILNDVFGIIRGVFLHGDVISLAIAFGSVVIAALIMQRASQIGAMTLLALFLFVIGSFLRAVVGGGPAEMSTADVAGAQLNASWSQFMNLQASSLLAYFIAFMVLILVFFAAKSVVSRG